MVMMMIMVVGNDSVLCDGSFVGGEQSPLTT